MKTMLIVFFIISLIVLLFVFPFKLRLMGHINLIEKKGYYSFKAWRIKLICGMIWYDEIEKKLKIKNVNNIIKNKYKDEELKLFTLNILKTIDVKKVELFFSGGFNNNSFSSAMVCGGARLIVDCIYSFLSQNYDDVKLFEDIVPTFNNDSFELTFDFVASISIYQIIWSSIKSKIKVLKEKNYV